MSNHLKKISSLLKVIENVTLFVSGLAIIVMMLLISSDVFFRNVFSFSVPAVYELSEKYLMPLAILPILLFVYNSKILPNFDFIVKKLPAKIHYFLNLLLLIIELFIFSLITVFSWQKAIDATQELLAFNAAGNVFPLYPLYYLVPIGFALLTIGIFIKCIQDVKKVYKPKDYLEVE